jgi:hypothetical protein
MEKNNSFPIALWILAGLSLVAGLLLSVNSLSTLSRTLELLERKAGDSRELATLQLQAARNQAILEQYSAAAAKPVPFETLASAAIPGVSMTTRTTATQPAVPGWTQQKISVDLTDINGSDLGKLLAAGAAAQPPWALVECTLFASPTAGRLAKATLVLETVEGN